MSNLSARLASRKMPHKDVTLCLNLDLLEQRDEAMKAVDAAARTARAQEQNERMVTGDSPAVVDARRRVAELDEQIRDESIILRVRGVDRHTYNQWMVECPGRKGKQEPFDPTRFYVHAAKNSAVYVDEAGAEHDISDDDWATIDKALLDGEHDRLAQAVLHVNRGVGTVDVGFFVNGSAVTGGSSVTSGSRGASASRPAASGAGNRKKSTSKK